MGAVRGWVGWFMECLWKARVEVIEGIGDDYHGYGSVVLGE